MRDACRIMNLKIFKVEIYERAIEPEFTEIFEDIQRTQDEKKSASNVDQPTEFRADRKRDR